MKNENLSLCAWAFKFAVLAFLTALGALVPHVVPLVRSAGATPTPGERVEVQCFANGECRRMDLPPGRPFP